MTWLELQGESKFWVFYSCFYKSLSLIIKMRRCFKMTRRLTPKVTANVHLCNKISPSMFCLSPAIIKIASTNSELKEKCLKFQMQTLTRVIWKLLDGWLLFMVLVVLRLANLILFGACSVFMIRYSSCVCHA